MQSKMISERELVEICMRELCVKAGFEGSNNIVQRDLEFLIESIESKTGILISLSTIKRLLNGQFSRLPQVATLHAVVIFLGYASWNDFKLSKNQRVDAVVYPEQDPEIEIPPRHTSKKFKLTKTVWFGALVILIVVALLVVLKIRNLNHFDNAQFSVEKVTNNDLPNSVVFRYNVDDVMADSFFIQQSWDKNRRVKIFKNNYTQTDIYYEPGYHVAKLIANDQIIKTLDVSIPTDRWFFYAKEKHTQTTPKYILSSEPAKQGSLQLTKNDLEKSQIDIHRENEYIQVYFPSKIEYSSDNFVFRTRIRIAEINNNLCPYFTCEVFCQRRFIFFSNTSKGCTSEVQAQFGENYLSGKTNDFSAMGLLTNSWNTIELKIQNKKVGIRINDTEVFSSQYNQSGGLITGLGFISNGLCEVDFVDLKTIDKKNIYSNDFDK